MQFSKCNNRNVFGQSFPVPHQKIMWSLSTYEKVHGKQFTLVFMNFLLVAQCLQHLSDLAQFVGGCGGAGPGCRLLGFPWCGVAFSFLFLMGDWLSAGGCEIGDCRCTAPSGVRGGCGGWWGSLSSQCLFSPGSDGCVWAYRGEWAGRVLESVRGAMVMIVGGPGLHSLGFWQKHNTAYLCGWSASYRCWRLSLSLSLSLSPSILIYIHDQCNWWSWQAFCSVLDLRTHYIPSFQIQTREFITVTKESRWLLICKKREAELHLLQSTLFAFRDILKKYFFCLSM